MSFTEKKRTQIKKYILEKIGMSQTDIVKKTSEAFQISLNTTYKYLRELEKEGIIEKESKKYHLVKSKYHITLRRSAGQLKEEDIIYTQHIKSAMENLPDNVIRIWQYSFMEMMNNAIEHSEAPEVKIQVSQDYMNTSISITDNGVGIFHKIKDYYNLETLDDAVSELFKGKLTTDKNNHSGEGIFFTSRILDGFAVISDGKIFTHNRYEEQQMDLSNILDPENQLSQKGTIIFMKLSNFSNKSSKEVFDMFSDENGSFVKTNIPIKNFFETYPVSRSQAKRLCHRFDKFKEVTLDFSGIEEIGQGFSHEIFVVFQRKHPEISLLPINMSPDVEKMVRHVQLTTL